MTLPPLRSHLYAPGNNPKLLERVFSAGADAVVLDLEDAVPPDQKAVARAAVAAALPRRAGRGEPVVFVRITHASTPWWADDVAAVVMPGLAGLRLPKVETVRDVALVADAVSRAEDAQGMAAGGVRLICTIESALGVWNALEIARADSRIEALAFGIADYLRDIGAHPLPNGLETLHARGQLVLASRVAGLAPPVDSVHTRLDDVEGLEAGARIARGLGFFGKSVIHPRQVEVANRVFTPDAAEIEAAQMVVGAYAAAERAGVGAVRLPNGEFVDPAIVRRCQDLLALMERLERRPAPEEQS